MEFNLYFYLRTDKINKKKEHPINLFYLFQRKLLKIPVGYSLKKEDWLENNLPSPNHKDFKFIWRKMDELEKKVRGLIFNHHSIYGTFPTIVQLKNYLNSHPIKQTDEVLVEDDLITKLFDDFIETSRRDDKTNTTISVYCTTKLHWLEFEEVSKTQYRVSDINYKLLEDFSLYLKNKDMMFSSVGKYIKTMKSLINYMIKSRKIKVDMSFKEIKVEREEENNFVTLDFEEYETLRNSITYSDYEIDGEKIRLTNRERLIGKLFLFMCSTGVSYVDLMNLRGYNFIVEKKELKLKNSEEQSDLMVYLKYDRQKVKKKTECIVPLHRHTLEVLLSFLNSNRYDAITRSNLGIPETKLKKWVSDNLQSFLDDPSKKKENDFKLFNKISNTDFNIEIKGLCEKLGFNDVVHIKEKKKNGTTKVYRKFECIASHTGRRTFVTLCLKLGVRPDVLMKSTGHLKMDTMRRYNRYTTTSIHEEFEKKVLNGRNS
jgi:hypothetical protein